MANTPTLSEDQRVLIDATLRRIRGGLDRAESRIAAEPAHIFTSVVQHARRS